MAFTGQSVSPLFGPRVLRINRREAGGYSSSPPACREGSRDGHVHREMMEVGPMLYSGGCGMGRQDEKRVCWVHRLVSYTEFGSWMRRDRPQPQQPTVASLVLIWEPSEVPGCSPAVSNPVPAGSRLQFRR